VWESKNYRIFPPNPKTLNRIPTNSHDTISRFLTDYNNTKMIEKYKKTELIFPKISPTFSPFPTTPGAEARLGPAGLGSCQVCINFFPAYSPPFVPLIQLISM
jgi:hypothetical protein